MNMKSTSAPRQAIPTIDDSAGMIAAYSGSAPLANRIYITIHDAFARIAFVEFPPSEKNGEPQFRAAVTLTMSDLQALKNLTEQVIEGLSEIPAENKDGSAKQFAE